MRILIVSGYFAPFAPMSGVRAGKLAKYLLARGHDVRVLAARDLPFRRCCGSKSRPTGYAMQTAST